MKDIQYLQHLRSRAIIHSVSQSFIQHQIKYVEQNFLFASFPYFIHNPMSCLQAAKKKTNKKKKKERNRNYEEFSKVLFPFPFVIIAIAVVVALFCCGNPK